MLLSMSRLYQHPTCGQECQSWKLPASSCVKTVFVGDGPSSTYCTAHTLHAVVRNAPVLHACSAVLQLATYAEERACGSDA